MKAPRVFFLSLLSAALLSGCGEKDAAAPAVATDLDMFVGTWTASSWVYSPLAGGLGVSQMPHSFVMTVNAAGSCVVDQHFPQDAGPRHLVGSVTIVSSGWVWIVAVEGGGDDENFYGTYAFSDNGNTVTMVSTDDWWFDFDHDEVEEPARLTIVLVKN